MNGDKKTFCQRKKKANSDDWWFDSTVLTAVKDFSCDSEAEKCFFAVPGGGSAAKQSCETAWKTQDVTPLMLYATFPDEDPAFTAVRFLNSLSKQLEYCVKCREI